MSPESIAAAEAEAKRFLTRVKAAKDTAEKHTWGTTYQPRESGALRRASMDLTRALAEMRRAGR